MFNPYNVHTLHISYNTYTIRKLQSLYNILAGKLVSIYATNVACSDYNVVSDPNNYRIRCLKFALLFNELKIQQPNLMP